MPPDKLETQEAGTPAPQQPADPLVTATPEVVVAVPPIGATEPQETDTTTDEGKVTTHQVPQDQFKKLKEKERDKGRNAALAEITKKVKEAGYESLDEALAKIPQLSARIDELLSTPEPTADKDDTTMAQSKGKTPNKSKRNGQPKRSNTRGKDDRMATKDAKEIARLGREREKDRAKWRKEEKRRKAAEQKLAAAQAEMEIREIAINAGVKDVDYAVRLMTRECAKLPKDKLAEFDENQFFTGLRDTKPYLFGETVAPANTGTGTGDETTPPEPKPGEVLTQTGDDSQFDAKTASKEDVDKRMRELGLSTSGSMAVG